MAATLIEVLKAILIGVVQGITEWLPISSTGHMILLDAFVGLEVSSEFFDFFLVAVQLGSILAVLVLFFDTLCPWGPGKGAEDRRRAKGLLLRVFVGCLPAAAFGVLLDDWLEEHTYNFWVVALALIAYGVVFILLERWRGRRTRGAETVEEITVKEAFLIGCFQVLSLIPGTSRSGSTILGASLLGVGRTAAAEFSFFMAIPVMVGASLLKGGKFLLSGAEMTGTEGAVLAAGMLTAFLVSLSVIRFLLEYVRRHSFGAFGWYRIALGLVVLLAGGGLARSA